MKRSRNAQVTALTRRDFCDCGAEGCGLSYFRDGAFWLDLDAIVRPNSSSEHKPGVKG